jgi:hypothetical protein
MSNSNLPTPGFHLQVTSQSGIFNPRVLLAFTFCAAGLLLAMLSLAAATPSVPLAPSSAGTWQIVPSPNADTTRQNELNGVTCVSASDCWAVGDYYTADNAYQTLIEHWDGVSWTIVASPNSDPTQTNLLFNVTCVSASDCWAVGKHKNIVSDPTGGALIIIDQTLIQHWDGTAWTIVTSPNSQPIESYLQDVACTSSSDCWVVGKAANVITGLYETQVEHWDGIAWALANSPNSPNTAADNYLQSVTCTSASDCWAVGFTLDRSTGIFQNLAERYDGTSWTLAATPDTSNTMTNILSGVTCTSSSDCWAAGYSDPGPGLGYRTLLERWDGTAWTIVPSPNTSANRSNFLYSVKCTSASDCWAIGMYYNGMADQTLIERWDGTAWTMVPSPNTSSTEYNDLQRVTCASASDCWSVGNYLNADNVHQTFMEHYTVSPAPISAVSRKTHPSSGTFDVDLLQSEPGIECRTGGAGGNHQVVITFGASVTVTGASVTPGPGGTASLALAPGVPLNQVIANLSNVSNAQTLTINLLDVNDGSHTGDVHIPMSVLQGDVTANGTVSNSDAASIKAEVAAPVTSSNFRSDVNANGVVSNTDVSITKAQVGTMLP